MQRHFYEPQLHSTWSLRFSPSPVALQLFAFTLQSFFSLSWVILIMNDLQLFCLRCAAIFGAFFELPTVSRVSREAFIFQSARAALPRLLTDDCKICSFCYVHEVVVNKLFSVHTWQFMRLLIFPTRFSLSCASWECGAAVGADDDYSQHVKMSRARSSSATEIYFPN